MHHPPAGTRPAADLEMRPMDADCDAAWSLRPLTDPMGPPTHRPAVGAASSNTMATIVPEAVWILSVWPRRPRIALRAATRKTRARRERHSTHDHDPGVAHLPRRRQPREVHAGPHR